MDLRHQKNMQQAGNARWEGLSEAEQARIKLEYETWTNKFKANHYTTELSFIFGNLKATPMKYILIAFSYF